MSKDIRGSQLRIAKGASAAGALFCAVLLGTATAHAQASVESFYKGKTISLVVGYPPGGSNDLYTRALTQFMGKHIPGNPNMILRNMPGAGSMVAANWMYNVAPKDGTTLALVAGTIPLESVLGSKQAKLNAEKFNWIGRISSSTNIVFMWHTSPVKTIEDATKRESILAATGKSSTVSIYPEVLNALIGTKFKVVLGYKGSAECMLAVERGEAEGHSTSYDGMNAAHPDWVADKKINIIAQIALQRSRHMPDVPTLVDLAKTDADKKAMRLITSGSDIGKSIFSPPGDNPERVAALRKAFDETMADPEFVAELKKLNVELEPLPGKELQSLIEEVGAAPADVLAKVKTLYPLD
jgi:tripartite-type tricarboxylate transporter receptor subunit TctC